MIYADDSDFPNKDKSKNDKIQQEANRILGKHSLKVNEDKWEITKIIRDKDREKELEWRKTKKLGSLLGDYEDMRNRVTKAKNMMNELEKLWPSKKVKEKRRIKIFKSITKSILTYNMSTWGLTKAQEDEFDREHRKMLRRVVGDKNMKNAQLYRRCKERKLSTDMRERRWQAFGHMLRLDEDTPCQMAMKYYFDQPTDDKKFKGRRRNTLPTCIDDDLQRTAKLMSIEVTRFENREDLEKLKDVAANRNKWKELTKHIVKCSDGDESRI